MSSQSDTADLSGSEKSATLDETRPVSPLSL